MKTYNLTEAAALLGVHVDTLLRWRRRLGGVGARGSAAGRRVWLTRADLARLARAHGRVLVDDGADVDFVELPREVAELRARVAELEQQIS